MRLVDFDVDPGGPLIVGELLRGETLAPLLAARGRRSVSSALRLMMHREGPLYAVGLLLAEMVGGSRVFVGSRSSS